MNFQELKEVIEINSFTGNKLGVDRVGKIFTDWMKELGYRVDIHKRESIGNHLHFISPKREGKKLLLLGHLDTVFPKGEFEGFREDDEWVYGAGVCDMKGGNYVAVVALRETLKELGEIYNIDLLLVSDEETGSDDSKALTMEIAKDYDGCLVYEAAGANEEVVIARKGIGTFFLDITGKAVHAGNHYKDGVDANLEAAIKLQKLVALTDLDRGTTVNVGKIEGGIGANTVSPKAKLTFEVRYENSKERDRVLEEVVKIVDSSFVKGSSSLLTGGIQRDVMEENQRQIDFLKELENITGDKLKVEKRGGVSDANIVASVGIPVLDGFGPYGDGDHTNKERALKSSFKNRVELSKKIFKAYSQGLK
jgi:glutamate carboxypeptidase